MSGPSPMWAHVSDIGQIEFTPEGVGEPHLTWRPDPDDPSVMLGVFNVPALEALIRAHVAEMPVVRLTGSRGPTPTILFTPRAKLP